MGEQELDQFNVVLRIQREFRAIEESHPALGYGLPDVLNRHPSPRHPAGIGFDNTAAGGFEQCSEGAIFLGPAAWITGFPFRECHCSAIVLQVRNKAKRPEGRRGQFY